MSRRVEPYDHDCDRCIWVGWFSPREDLLTNVYFCPAGPGSPAGGPIGSIIIRFSSDGPDYWSSAIWPGDEMPHAIMVHDENREER